MKRIAAIQMASGPSVSANLIEAGRWISYAADAGADLVVLPEFFAIMGMKQEDMLEVKEQYGNGKIQDFIKQMCVKHRVWIVAGTIPIETDDANHVRAACLLFDSDGNIITRYDKVHLFDVNLDDDEQYSESDVIEAGSNVVVHETPFGCLGLAVCYDLRFPEMFRQMVDKGASIFVIPAAFTAMTGKAHWESLLRARAIENLSYVIASAQGGYHLNGRETHGDSMIIDPWGEIKDRLERGSGFVMADLDQDKTKLTRKQFPVLEHRKLECYKKSS